MRYGTDLQLGRRVLVGVAVTVVLLALAACGGGGSAAPTVAPTEAPTIAPTEAPAEAATEVAAQEAEEVAATVTPAEEVAVVEATEEPASEVEVAEATTEAAEESEEVAATVVPAEESGAAESRAAAEGELFIDAANQRGSISPLIYGANNGPLWALLPAFWEDAAALGLKVIHYPGGEWGDRNDLSQREIDNFAAQGERLGAESFISVRLPGGTPGQAAALVEYANLTQGYGITYWAIGNEPNYYARSHGEEWTAQHHADRWREIALAMKEVDPTIKLVGPEVDNFEGVDAEGRSVHRDERWLRTFLETNGDIVDVVSIHYYPFPKCCGTRPENATLEEARVNPRDLDRSVIPDLRALIHEVTGREIPVAITEIGLDSRNLPPRLDTLPGSPFAAIWYGDVLARLIDQQVHLVTYWTLVTRDNQGGHGIFDNADVRPIFHVFDLYRRFGDELVDASTGNEDVFAVASIDDEGNLTVMLSNTSLEPETLTVNLEGFAAGETVEALRVLGTEKGSSEIDEVFAVGSELTLPPLSLTLFVVAPE